MLEGKLEGKLAFLDLVPCAYLKIEYMAQAQGIN